MPDFGTPNSSLKVSVFLDSDGNIADTWTNTEHRKTITLEGFKTDGTYSEALTIIDAIFGDKIVDKKKTKKVTIYVVEIDVEYSAEDIAQIFNSYQPVDINWQPEVQSILNGSYVVRGNTFSADDF